MSRKGEESREQIVATAWEMVDELGVEQLLAGVSMRNIADRMGLSPSTVSYHFAGPEDLARGMIESMIASIDLTPLEALVEIMGTIDSDMELVDMVRTSTQADLDALTAGRSVDFERLHMRVLAATGSHEAGAELAATLRDRIWGRYLPPFTALIDAVCDRFDRHFAEPFTSLDMARSMTAMVERLFHQWIVDPDGVRPDLAADAVVAMASALMLPNHHEVHISELDVAFVDPGAPSPDPDDVDRRRVIAVAAHGLFSVPLGDVTLTQIARASDSDPRSLVELFGSVSRVAAVSFVRWMPELRATLERRRGGDAQVGLADYLCELVRAARSDPFVAAALVAERGDLDRVRRDDIRALVPIERGVLSSLETVRPGLSDGERCDLATLLADTTLAYALSRPTTAPHRVAELVLRLVPMA